MEPAESHFNRNGGKDPKQTSPDRKERVDQARDFCLDGRETQLSQKRAKIQGTKTLNTRKTQAG